jgi:hypothetical protein
MKTFEFIIIASGGDPDADDFFDRFYDAGLDDATVAYQRGRIIVDVAREASSIDEAIATAVRDVRKAGATVLSVEPDLLVSQAEIADRTGLTPAAVSNYVKGNRREGFPAPERRVGTTSPLWDWSTVATWFYQHDKLPREAVVEALAVKAANSSLSATHFEVALKDRLKDEEAHLEAAE